MADLLIELFSEEIPARMQAKAAGDLKRLMGEALKAAGLSFDGADAFATPRRLALHMTGIPESTPDVREERRGPRADAPEKAIEGFLRGAGVAREDLVERADKKGTFLYAIIEREGRAASDVIAEALADTVKNFPWPKSQRWGTKSKDSTSLRWVRPLHSILCLFDGAVVDLEVDGIKSGNTTRGHRFMAPDEFSVSDFADYKQKLLDHKVILDPARRQTLVHDTAQTLASAAGLELVADEGLIAEVAGLVEWPVPMIGSFDASFLEVPEEVLILTMKKDQKYLVTRDPATGKLANKFIFTANIEPSDDGSAVTGGNERVIDARLSDAKFFWEQDLKGKLEDNLPALEEIVFHIDLGTVAERVERMKKLSRYLADFIPGCDADAAERAAELAKADLVSGMVYEFPEVQGVMGRYYAQAQGESDAVANAIRDHYAPLGPSDDCPSEPVSIAVALAEKLDTLVGFFGINQKPTGSKDPYALRRAALGVIRLITENRLNIELEVLLKAALSSYIFIEFRRYSRGEKTILGKDVIQMHFVFEKTRAFLDDVGIFESELRYQDEISRSKAIEAGFVQPDAEPDDQAILYTDEAKAAKANAWVLFADPKHCIVDLLNFFGDRLKVQQRDKGVRHDLIDAVFAKGDDDLVRILNRVAALSAFLESDDGANLLAGYKRAANILKIEEKKDGVSYDKPVEVGKLAATEAEALSGALASAKEAAENALISEDFEGAMAALSGLRAPIDIFFDKVIVNADEADVRANRLALLSEIRSAVNTVADFSVIEG
ncbi:MAG: glycine--tRNA ligase subunit beta [Kordiimonadaceae bacterium]|nr:glycine--tRNA ligase subunit beta [Kordiimonadaceae bacterium]MBO6569114.1 glycine--tRNA ligase subunit beta [Kordiimonadaceae bacterium]MBO6964589.1 glycine--tRNA ligase subunit beta [Kordiimonadaceae bacterium]